MANDRIRVAARVRPLSLQEEERGESTAVRVQDENVVVLQLPAEPAAGGPRASVLGAGPREGPGRPSVGGFGRQCDGAQDAASHAFGFDHTFTSARGDDVETQQEDVYNQIGRPLLQDSLEGISGCLFAYGISGSGKTFSLLGGPEAPGVLPLLADELLEAQREAGRTDGTDEVRIHAAFLELYNENLVDLLSDSRDRLRLFESREEGVVVPGLLEAEVQGRDSFSSLLDLATSRRSVGETRVNTHSSRSHMLVQLRVQRTSNECTTRAKVHVIDLAGSERQRRARSEGARMKEGIHINVSLSALGLVISRLSEIAQGRNHCSVPFRDSKLTFLLKDSLSGNARTQVLVALTPASSCAEESLSTLRFAQSVKKIHTRAVADIIKAGALRADRDLQALQAEVNRLKAELDSKFLDSMASCSFCRGGKGADFPSEPAEASCDAGGKQLRRLQGQYLSPTNRTIQVGGDGSVVFQGGSDHHPIRISPPASPEAEEEDASGGGAEYRLYSEGDPEYRYLLVAEEEGALVWRHEDNPDADDANELIRWQRVASQHEAALGRVRRAAAESKSLGPVAAAAELLLQRLVPSKVEGAADELVLLCEEIDETNVLLGRAGVTPPAAAAGASSAPRLEATWLAPEPNPDLPPRELLRVKATTALGREIWSLDEFRARLQVLRQGGGSAADSWAQDPRLLRRRVGSFWAGRGHDPEVSPAARGPPRSARAPAGRGEQHRASPARAASASPPSAQAHRCRSLSPRASGTRGSGRLSPAPRALWKRSDPPTVAFGQRPPSASPKSSGPVVPPVKGLPSDRAAFAHVSPRPGPGPLVPRSSLSPWSLPRASNTSPPPMPRSSSGSRGEFHTLRGSYSSTSGVTVEVGLNGTVDFGGATLLMKRQDGEVLLSNPACAGYGPYRLLAQQPDGVLLWQHTDPAEREAAPIKWAPAAPVVRRKSWSEQHPPVPEEAALVRNASEGAEAPRPRAAPAHRASLPGALGDRGGGGGGPGARRGRSRHTMSHLRQRPWSADGPREPATARERGTKGAAQPSARTWRRSQSAIQPRGKLGVPAGPGDACAVSKAFDKNSMRLRNGQIFVDALERWRFDNGNSPASAQRKLLPGMCAVYVRKRPMFERDSRRCDYDVLSVVRSGTGDEQDEIGGQEITHHACMFDKSMVTPFVVHTQFPFDGVFDDSISNEGVYHTVARPLLENTLGGNLSTLFVFGQTGSGKTYTMRAIERMAVEELFDRLDEGAQVRLNYFELAGRKALDLLAESKAEIRLREEEDGCFRPRDCEEPVVSSAAELLGLMGEAAGRRATDATTVNSTSSRSHSVCRISVLQDGKAVGRLLLVDCAGTERSRDSLFFKGATQRESAEINSSLFALKDCIRSRQAALNRQGGHLPDGRPLRLTAVRASPLTKVLAESLLSRSAQLAAIGTVSPNATDAEHTIDTLRTVYTLGGRPEQRVVEARQVLE